MQGGAGEEQHGPGRGGQLQPAATTFTVASIRARHMRTQHPDNTQDNECPLCLESLAEAASV